MPLPVLGGFDQPPKRAQDQPAIDDAPDAEGEACRLDWRVILRHRELVGIKACESCDKQGGGGEGHAQQEREEGCGGAERSLHGCQSNYAGEMCNACGPRRRWGPAGGGSVFSVGAR